MRTRPRHAGAGFYGILLMMRNDSLTPASNSPESTVVIDLGGTNLRLGHIGADGPHPAAETLPTERLRQAEPISFLVSAVKRYVQREQLDPRRGCYRRALYPLTAS